MTYKLTIQICLIPLLTSFGCGEGSRDMDGYGTVILGDLDIELSAWQASFPQDLIMVSPTTDRDLTPMDSQSANLQDSPRNQSYLSKLARLKKTTTTGSIAQCFAAMPDTPLLSLAPLALPPCFGPTVSSNFLEQPIESGNLGIWWDFNDPLAYRGKACSSAISNQLMSHWGRYGETAVGLAAFAACIARIRGEVLPSTPGTSRDLTPILKTMDTSSSYFSLSTLSIMYDGLSSAGQPKFSTSIQGSLRDEQGLSRDFKLTITQMIGDNDYSSYKGSIGFRLFQKEQDQDEIISLNYQHSNEEGLSYRFRRVQIPLEGATQRFDPATLEVSPNLFNRSWVEILAEYRDSDDNKQTYLWQNLSQLILNIESKPDGTGTAYFGHRDRDVEVGSQDSYRIQGYACLPKNLDMFFSDGVQKQDLFLDLDTGYWAVEASHTLFAPTATCNSGTGEDYTGSSGSFTKIINGPITHELAPLEAYQEEWLGPRLPQLNP